MCSPNFIYFSSDVDKIQYSRCPQKNITQLLVLVKSTNERQVYLVGVNEFVISIFVDLFYMSSPKDICMIWAFLCFVRIGTGKTKLPLCVKIKRHLGLCHETVWPSESGEHHCEVCVLQWSTPFLVLYTNMYFVHHRIRSVFPLERPIDECCVGQ